MRQVVSGKLGIEVIEVPAPRPEPGCVLVAVRYSLISAGTEAAAIAASSESLLRKAMRQPDKVAKVFQKLLTDGIAATVDQVRGKLDAYQLLGYSCAGEVVAVGEDVTDLQPGDRVACAGAGLANHAEFVCVPRQLIVPVPADLDLRSAAAVTLGAIALQGVRRANPTLGETFLVQGLGLIGQLVVQLLLANGCRVLAVDPDPARSALVGERGAIVLDGTGDVVGQAMQHTGQIGVDGVVICAATTSDEPVNLAMRACRRKGRVVVVGAVGLDLEREALYTKELDVLIATSYGPGRYDPAYEEKGLDYPIAYVRWTENRNMAAFLDLQAAGRVDVAPLIQREFAIDEAAAAFALLQDDSRPLGIMLRYAATEPGRRIDVTPRPAVQSVRISLIGAGGFAQSVLLPILGRLPGVQLRGLVSRSGTKVRQLAQQYDAAWCGSDPADVWADAETNLVVIASRHVDHASQVIAALKAGKHIFVEKPLCLNQGDLHAITAAVTASGLACMVGFNRRFSPLSRQLKSALDPLPGPAMILYRVNAGGLPSEHWTRDRTIGGGRLIGEACHFIDWISWMVGTEPVSCHASGRPDGEDVSLTLRYADGSVGTLVYTAMGDPGLEKERIEVHKAGCSGVIENFQRLQVFGPTPVEKRLQAVDKGHRDELHAFVDALTKGMPVPLPFAEAAATMAWTFAAEEQLRNGVGQVS